MLLPSLISLRKPLDEPLSAEDIFSSSLGGIFTDDLQNSHGDGANTVIVYRSHRHGDLEFRTADVNGEEQRKKFAHYLWNAGILIAELVSGRPQKIGRDSGMFVQGADEQEKGWGDCKWWVDEDEEKHWNMEGHMVLELGAAGVGLAGIASALSGAQEVAMTDYPAPPIIEAIITNVGKNTPASLRPQVSVHGHQWGHFDDSFADSHAHSYTRILAADCFWMPHEHDKLARSMLHFLSQDPNARIHCVAGFHTGRANLVPFFGEIVPNVGLEVEDIYEMDAEGNRRPWAKERDGGREDVTGRKKWLVVARLRRSFPS
ncbi:hypothetical protein EJ04DRAFT_447740 [Polyplosphaeria fusca]|uniref:Nicotinamide N-methyltransferase n=1 Tax=Polyplosphaeria fusca TaxID=682080 RepID=A0A9P4QQR5_9PLEO|nr:hypothetical protein EJ04DRAFT_447740 [Polyplosphaeria fusca]